MAFRVKVNDVTVEVDTPDELLSLLAKMGAFQGKAKASGILEALPPSITIPAMAGKMADFYKRIRRTKTHMLTILEALYKVDSLTTSELKNIISVESPHAFGGAIAGITKVAERCMLGAEDILSKNKEKASGEVRYQLTSSMREVIQTEKERGPQPIRR